MKWVFAFLSLVLAGCLTTTEQLAMSPLYQVTSKDYQDIRGDFTVESFLLYKEITWGSNTTVTIDRWLSAQTWYTITVRFLGPDWRFMERVILKTDEGLYELEDSSPTRDVNDNALVQEVVRIELPEGILADLRQTRELRLQYFAGPVDIPSEGLRVLQGFLLSP